MRACVRALPNKTGCFVTAAINDFDADERCSCRAHSLANIAFLMITLSVWLCTSISLCHVSHFFTFCCTCPSPARIMLCRVFFEKAMAGMICPKKEPS